ncbi:MAG: hypothetical protein HY819_04040 [Acidobacteria bacterium]|nr:hypothetical protein [Acidobacteriota bacterium]
MSMDDARAKIEEMLRQKRQATSTSTTNSTQVVSSTSAIANTPVLAPKTNSQESSGSNLTKINEMLRQKQIGSLNNVNTELNVAQKAPIQTTTKPRYGLCPSCLADLDLVAGLYLCKNCSQHFVRRGLQGDLINSVDLPYGYCKCCETHFPLVKAPNNEILICSVSQERYLLSAKGYLRASELPFGLCSCCNLPNPLIARPDRTISCINSNQEYIRNIDGTVVCKPQEINLQNNQDIEQALNQGMAAFYYGGFVGGQEPEPPPVEIPRRQRRRWFL